MRNWTNFKITFHMQTPIMLAHPWLHLDGILSHLLNRENRGLDYWNLPSKEPIEPAFPIRRMPLKSTRDVFHASVSFFDTDITGATTLYKRFYEQQSHIVETKKSKVDLMRGVFRMYMMRMPIIPAQQITFYACGDLKEVLRLIEYLPAIGKKTACGFGAIKSISVEETPEDYSLVKDGKAMRPIPIEMCKYASEVMMLAYRPPYWDKRLVKPCAPPGAEVEILLG